VRQVRHERHQAVVHAGVDRHRARPDRANEAVEALEQLRARLGTGREEPGRAAEEVAAREGHARALGAAHRVAADEPLAIGRRQRPQQRRLGRAEVRDEAPLGRRGERAAGEALQRGHGRREHDRLGPLGGLLERAHGPVDRPHGERHAQRLGVRVDPHDLAVGAEREPQGAAHEPHADDGDGARAHAVAEGVRRSRRPARP